MRGKKLSFPFVHRLFGPGRSPTLFAVLLLLIPGLCLGANNVMIINGSSGTTEPATTANVTANLSAYITAAGGTPTVSDPIPASLAGYTQVWDVRFSSTLPLSASDIAQYVAYLHGGGVMFVAGEDASFGTRNTSVIALIAAVGGGNLTYVVPIQTQTVLAPFTLPNPVTSITYLFSGGLVGSPAPGTGAFMTVDTSNNGSGIWWTHGQMSNAPNGVLAVVFDVNFMETFADANSQSFLQNIVGLFERLTAPPTVPALSEWALVLLGLLLVVLAARALRAAPSHRQS